MIGYEEFVKKIKDLNEKGNEYTLEHKKKHKDKHSPGTDSKCKDCLKIIDCFDKIMELQKLHFQVYGIPVDSLLSAMYITKVTIEMIEVDKNRGKTNKNDE